ncbi:MULTISPECIES: hypothetical protein [Flavobacterium]|uniref:hypothetical protein n=1 Tax=Flavobacterium TaxID=237 RepID=UPI002114D2E6|nr:MULTISPECIES: hypothetical protein [Flavobacterium]UUF15193.1 hypothetical protein NLJ00_03600 [Flavobacterium panici]
MENEPHGVEKLASNLKVMECMHFIESILGYKLSAGDKQSFLFFHNYITNPEPEFLINWKNDPTREIWYHKFSNRILGDVQNAFPCVLYHFDKLVELEGKLFSGIEKFNFRDAIGKNCGVGGGNTLIFDFEYQAYILAYRRCLDYLARAIGTYFMQDFNSFRKLGSFLKKLNRPIVTEPLIKLHEKYSPCFDFVLSEGNKKSVRDIISHYEFVSVGTINLNNRGIIIASGGKNDFVLYGEKNLLLSEVLHNQVSNLKLCIREFIYIYVDSIKKEEFTRRDSSIP